MGWDVILFDLDGTLTDSGPGIMHAAQYALDAFGVHVEDARTLSFFVGPPLVETFARYFPPEQVPAAIEQFRKYYRETGWLENEPYPGVGECLQALAAQGKKMFVATSKLEEMARRVLTHFGLMQYFTDVCGGLANDPGSGKKINVVRRALTSAGCPDGTGAVLVGDRSYDVLGGHEAGLQTVGVLYGYGSREELTSAGADLLAETPEELKTILL